MNLETKNTFETFVSGMIATYNEKFVRDFMFSLESEEKFCIPAEKLLEWKVFELHKIMTFMSIGRKIQSFPEEEIEL